MDKETSEYLIFYIFVNMLCACFYISVIYFRLALGSFSEGLLLGSYQKILMFISLIFLHPFRFLWSKKVGTLLAV